MSLGPDTDAQLIETLEWVNRHHLDGRVYVPIAWEIPPVLVTVGRVSTGPGILASNAGGMILSKAKLDYPEAKRLLGGAAESGNRDAAEILCAAARTLGLEDDFRHWNRIILGMSHGQTMSPVSCVVRDEVTPGGRILVHPYLRDRNAPRYVLRYVVYHECIHCLVPEGANGKHSAAFMEYEMAAPARDRANEWLTANNFPTLDITYEDPRALRAAGRAP